MSEPLIKFSDVDANFVPRPRTHVACEMIDDVAVLYDEAAGVCHRLNPIATVVWSHLGDGLTINELVDELGTIYRQERSRIATDVVRLVRHLGELGLLEGVMSRSEEAFADVADDDAS